LADTNNNYYLATELRMLVIFSGRWYGKPLFTYWSFIYNKLL